MAVIHQTQIRQEILETTRKLLVKYGYNFISMRKIASNAGCALGTIYLYFDNKDILIHSLIDEGFEKMYNMLLDETRKYEQPDKRLEVLCKKYISFGLEYPEYYEIMYLLHPERMKRYPKEKFRRARRTFDLVAEILDEVAENRGIMLKDSTLISYSIWASLHGVVTILLARRLDKRIDQNDFIDNVVQRTLRSVI